MEKVFKRVLVITLLSNLLSKMLVKGQFITDSCGTSKTCWRSVADCTLSEPNCLFFSSAWVSRFFRSFFSFRKIAKLNYNSRSGSGIRSIGVARRGEKGAVAPQTF